MVRFLTHPDKVSMENMTLKTLVLDTVYCAFHFPDKIVIWSLAFNVRS